jgi:hypothetical protein
LTQEFTITVSNTNDAPFFTSVPIVSIIQNNTYVYTMIASDIDLGDSLTYAAPTLPDWLDYDDISTISGVPDSEGEYPVLLTVTDGIEIIEQSFTITVFPLDYGNTPPVFTSAPDTSAVEDEEYNYPITADDVDTNNVLIITGEYPDWLIFVDNNDGTALLNGTPTNDDVGDHSVVLTVSYGFVFEYRNREFLILCHKTITHSQYN